MTASSTPQWPTSASRTDAPVALAAGRQTDAHTDLWTADSQRSMIDTCRWLIHIDYVSCAFYLAERLRV